MIRVAFEPGTLGGSEDPLIFIRHVIFNGREVANLTSPESHLVSRNGLLWGTARVLPWSGHCKPPYRRWLRMRFAQDVTCALSRKITCPYSF